MEPKSALRVENVAAPECGDGDVLVALQAAALNRRDYWITEGLYPGVTTPVTLGSDGAGVVTAVGAQVDSAWIDQEVIINPGLDWGTNHTHQGRDFHILGMPTDGTFAQQVAIPAGQLYPKPAHLDWHQAAALPLAGVTAYRATFSQGQLQPGQSLLITGIGGGVATYALQLAATKLANGPTPTIAVTSSSPTKLESALGLGASHAFNYREESWIKLAKQECGGFDLIIDGAGGGQYEALMSLSNPGGTIVSYGSTAGAPDALDLFKLFWKQLRLVGSTMGSPADFSAMIEHVNQQQLIPVIDCVLPLKDANQAVQRMGRAEHCGKIVLDCSRQ